MENTSSFLHNVLPDEEEFVKKKKRYIIESLAIPGIRCPSPVLAEGCWPLPRLTGLRQVLVAFRFHPFPDATWRPSRVTNALAC